MTWAIATVCGNLGAKPTIKHFDTGNVVCNFVLYVNRQKSTEEDQIPPLKIYAEVWGKQAETCVNLLDKGARVTITGNLDEETYLDKEGKPVTQVRVRFAQVLDYGLKPSGDREAE